MSTRRASPRHTAAAASLACLASLLWAAPASAQGQMIVVRSPVGNQYLSFGAQSGVWVGDGTISALPEGATTPGEEVGSFVDLAWPLGPVSIGISHVVAESVMFELRLGAGAALFTNDRLVSTSLTGEGESHLAWTAGAEVGGRWFHSSGFTAGLGSRLAAVGLPDGRSTWLGVAPRVGYIGFDERFTSYWVVEAFYEVPFINGFIPEFEGVSRPPIESTWHMIGVHLGVGI